MFTRRALVAALGIMLPVAAAEATTAGQTTPHKKTKSTKTAKSSTKHPSHSKPPAPAADTNG